MIERIALTGFAPLAEEPLALEPLTVLLGAGGCGKSRCLKGIELALRAARGESRPDDPQMEFAIGLNGKTYAGRSHAEALPAPGLADFARDVRCHDLARFPDLVQHETGFPVASPAETADPYVFHGNLQTLLAHLQQNRPGHYETLGATLRFVQPDFRGFRTQTTRGVHTLCWEQAGQDAPLPAAWLSDAFLRFAATGALLGLDAPSLLLLDNPDAGLNPFAITMLAACLLSASRRGVQVVVATQSPLLVDELGVGCIRIAEKTGGNTAFRQVDAGPLQPCFDDGQTPGDLWRRNLLTGRPA